MTDIVSFIYDSLFRFEDRRILKIEFIAWLVYIFLFILCDVALYAPHRLPGRALSPALALTICAQCHPLFILVAPGTGALMYFPRAKSKRFC